MNICPTSVNIWMISWWALVLLIKICWNLVIFFLLMEARMTSLVSPRSNTKQDFFFSSKWNASKVFCFHWPLQLLFVQFSGPVYSTWRSLSKAVIHAPPLPGHTPHLQPPLSNTHHNSGSHRRCAGALCRRGRFVWWVNGEMPEGDCRVHVGLRHRHHSAFYSDAQWPALNLRPASEKKRHDGCIGGHEAGGTPWSCAEQPVSHWGQASLVCS